MNAVSDEVSMVAEISAEPEQPSVDEVNKEMPIMTLRNMLMFTGIVMPVTVGRQATLKLVRSASKNKQHIIIA
ncbi:MAG TPA: LON peptidase substrate-binding domain-containing protein, partial [Candidatus Phocaeicola caecigallinarum]|nr:LON peptidase substrate-binding domain-containing protein [Candidatus Phocaeicola caecigallinarum]